MLENLARIEARFNELTEAMSRPEVATDYLKLAEYGQERSNLEPIVARYREYIDILAQIEEARELMSEDDAEMVELAKAELAELEPRAEPLNAALKLMLLPREIV